MVVWSDREKACLDQFGYHLEVAAGVDVRPIHGHFVALELGAQHVDIRVRGVAGTGVDATRERGRIVR